MSSVTRLADSQADIAYRTIRQLVLAGGGSQETIWFERQFGEQLQMSRTPVREALKRLQNEGLLAPVTASGGLGTAQISTEEVGDVYRLREVLEALAADLAAARSSRGELSRVQLTELKDRADSFRTLVESGNIEAASQANQDLHELISSLAANPFLEGALNRLWGRIAVSAISNLIDDPSWVSEVLQQHDEIVQRIVEGEPAEASRVAGRHIQRALEVYVSHHVSNKKEGTK